MYEKDLKAWKSEGTDEKRLEKYRSEGGNSPEAQYFLADDMLSKAESGKETANAVYMMETAAKSGYIKAAFAMGQMFQYGWAVKKSIGTAVKWYEKAAQLGSTDAAEILETLKKKKTVKISSVAVCCAAAVLIFVGIWFFGGSKSSQKVLVDKGVKLTETVTEQEFVNELSALISEYDDAQTISGERSTNRLLLRFEGDNLDLRGFLADKVISREDNRVVIQFSSEEEAQRCLELLKNTDGIIYVEEDQYEETINMGPRAETTGQMYDEKFISKYNDNTYYSWGIIHMNMDALNAWVQENDKGNSVVVAVVDSGVVPNEETEDRILQGTDMVVYGSDGTVDIINGHGTHVSGIILDACQGLDVKILPVRVMGGMYGTTSAIACGISYAIEQGVDVINLSLSGGHSALKDDLIKQAIDAGITVVVSAGNEATDTHYSCPAHNTDCIVVSAYGIDEHGNPSIADFSNYGSTVSVSAPGVEVLSYWKDDSNVDELLKKYNRDDDDGSRGTNRLDSGIYVEFENGTSMAAPHISALAAMIKLMVPDASPEEVKQYIQHYCVDMGDSAHFGSGICNAGMLAGD